MSDRYLLSEDGLTLIDIARVAAIYLREGRTTLLVNDREITLSPSGFSKKDIKRIYTALSKFKHYQQ